MQSYQSAVEGGTMLAQGLSFAMVLAIWGLLYLVSTVILPETSKGQVVLASLVLAIGLGFAFYYGLAKPNFIESVRPPTQAASGQYVT